MRLIPRDENFYVLFSDIADRLLRSAKLLNQLFDDPSRLPQNVAAIKELEHQADNITHDVIERIDRTFVTPFDREDIHLLAAELDDVVDLLDGAARRADMFGITERREDAVRLTDVVVRAATTLDEAVRGMKIGKLVYGKSRELKVLEEEGDAIYHEAMGRLFSDGADPIDVIKWKELYDKIEDALDKCEDVGNVLQSIAIKNS